MLLLHNNNKKNEDIGMVTKAWRLDSIKLIHTVVELSRPLNNSDTSPISSHNIDSNDIIQLVMLYSPYYGLNICYQVCVMI